MWVCICSSFNFQVLHLYLPVVIHCCLIHLSLHHCYYPPRHHLKYCSHFCCKRVRKRKIFACWAFLFCWKISLWNFALKEKLYLLLFNFFPFGYKICFINFYYYFVVFGRYLKDFIIIDYYVLWICCYIFIIKRTKIKVFKLQICTFNEFNKFYKFNLGNIVQF